jgi:hypothetical protein
MRLIRLLTAGKSWLIVNSEPNRYRDVRQKLIPNLQRLGLEFPAAAKPNPIACGDSSQPWAAEAQNDSSVPIARTAGKSACRDAAVESGPSYAARLWSKLLHPFLTFVAPNKIQPPLGGARLDAVRVVRNELTEMDLELVGPASRARTERAGAKADRLGRTAGKVAGFSRFAGQLFEVGRLRH